MSRSIFETIDPEILREQARRSRARLRAAALIGAGGCSVPKTATDPDCYDVEHIRCYYEIVAQSALAVAGVTAFTIQIEPNNCPFFDPRAVSATVTDGVDPGLPRMARFTDVNIQGCPQEAIRNAAPTAATTAFWNSTKWDPRTRSGCACPVAWGIFSNLANSYPLNVVGFNPHPAGITISVTIEVYGDCLSVLEANMQCGTRRNGPKKVVSGVPRGSAFPTG